MAEKSARAASSCCTRVSGNDDDSRFLRSSTHTGIYSIYNIYRFFSPIQGLVSNKSLSIKVPAEPRGRRLRRRVSGSIIAEWFPVCTLTFLPALERCGPILRMSWKSYHSSPNRKTVLFFFFVFAHVCVCVNMCCHSIKRINICSKNQHH